MRSIQVLVVDDSFVYRSIIKRIIESLENFTVIGMAANGREALDKIEQLHPDLVTMDVEMPEMSGLEALQIINDRKMNVAVLMISSVSEQSAHITMQALSLSAIDFIPKPNLDNKEDNERVLKETLQSKIQVFFNFMVKKSKVSFEDLLQKKVHNLQDLDKVAREAKKKSQSTLDQKPDSPSMAEKLFSSSSQLPTMPRLQDLKQNHYQIVAIGLSTGGPKALGEFLPLLSKNFPLPIVIVQHMPKHFTDQLAKFLDSRCALNIFEASEGRSIQAGDVAIAPGGWQLKVEKISATQLILHCNDSQPVNGFCPSADVLFQSVHQQYGSHCIGVIMTGMGTDGAEQLRQLKNKGGYVISQNESSCVVFGMSRIPVQEGFTDCVVDLKDMAQAISIAAQGSA